MFESVSKSKSIRNIENKYCINLSKCTKHQLDDLTSDKSKKKVINRLSDLMIDEHQFDIDNMTDIERNNLKYLVMSTDEVLNVLKAKTKSLYFKPSYARLRFLMPYDDFYQTCAHKLLLNDGILKFNANYNFECALHFWFDRVAGWKCKHKANIADEVCILDNPVGDDLDGTTVGDLMLHDSFNSNNDLSIEVSQRVKSLLDHMNKTNSTHIIIKAADTFIPYSEYNLAKLFIVYHFGKKELSKMMYNTLNNKLVSNQIFNKFYKNTLSHIAELINTEAAITGENFEFNINEL